MDESDFKRRCLTNIERPKKEFFFKFLFDSRIMNTLKNLESRKVNSDYTSLNCSKSTDVDLAACVNVIEICH